MSTNGYLRTSYHNYPPQFFNGGLHWLPIHILIKHPYLNIREVAYRSLHQKLRGIYPAFQRGQPPLGYNLTTIILMVINHR